MGEEFCNFHLIGPDLLPRHIGVDNGLPRFHLFRFGNLYRFHGGQLSGGQRTKNAVARVGRQGTDILPFRVKNTVKLPRLPLFALFHIGDTGGQNAAPLQRHQLGRVDIVDPVAQRPKGPCIRVVVGHCTNARHGIPQPCSQFIGAIGGTLYRLGGDLHRLSVPHGPDRHLLPADLRQLLLDLLHRVHLGGVDVGDDVPFLQSALPGRDHRTLRRRDLGKAHHQNTVRKQFDTYRPAHRDHSDRLRGPGRGGPHGQHRRQQQPQPPKDCRPHKWSRFFIQIHSPPF